MKAIENNLYESRNTKNKMQTRDLIMCSLFAAVIAVCAQISIPFPGGVPLTMQVLAISLSGMLLGSKKAFLSVIIYLMIGAIGMPVFQGFTGGLQAIVGTTGGYLYSFPLLAYIVGYISERSTKVIPTFLAMVVGLTVVYIVGTIHFSYLTGHSIAVSLGYCVIPFIFTDTVKIILATIIGDRLKNHKAIKSMIA